MTSSIEVKKEIEGRLSDANANEKYLYSRVMELEKRNQKLEKRVNKLKRKKKELKQEVARLREKIQSQGSVSMEVEELTGQDEDLASASGAVVEVDVEEEMEEELSNFSRRSNNDFCTNDVSSIEDHDDEAADDPDVVDELPEVDQNQSNVQCGLNNEEETDDVNSNEVQDDEAVDDQGELEDPAQQSGHHGGVQNQCSQCGKSFSTARKLAKHIKGVHVPKKKCNVCQKLVSAKNFNTHVKEAHEGDRRECPECKKAIASSQFSRHMQMAHLGFKKKCPRCGKLVTKLNCHIREVHQGIRKKCPHCSKGLTSSGLWKHIKAAHNSASKSS